MARRFSARSGAGAVAAALALFVAAGSATAAHADPAPTGPSYVALGDSRASGPLIEASEHRDFCLHSPNANYPAKLAAQVGASSFTDVTCSAAKPSHVIDTPQFVGTRTAPPQLDALSPDTELVTLSIGGGGSNHLPVSLLCAAPVPDFDGGCRDNPLAERLATEGIEKMAREVDAVVGAIVAKAPDARVYVVSHGGTVGDRACWPILPVGEQDAPWLRDYFDRFNDIYVRAAEKYDVEYIDIATAAVEGGHDGCAPTGERWFEGIVPRSPAEPAHPNELVMSAIADMIAADYATVTSS
ncbi:SGNH/GDSL hydrolase family protein [Rhodococcus rhodnii]|uniref:Esterase n=2 Tax=Rhodococcus rhodnii TaxID=38312 RepID=R7WR08_9NOCA|nr:SGNH/GDSL hydrolase family protein [Rhodococcus rhodnii]EOM76404.1 esterase [Rhodococcus rhodnii LMG 5362]TXG91527.1 SGNH/GDSL hydrolase family protein [Rhodococcus rhodnii]